MFHHFPEELERQDYLVNALEIKYQEGPAITYLKSAQQAAFVLRSENDPPPAESDKGSPYLSSVSRHWLSNTHNYRPKRTCKE
jgi:hypothetical protein